MRRFRTRGSSGLTEPLRTAARKVSISNTALGVELLLRKPLGPNGKARSPPIGGPQSSAERVALATGGRLFRLMRYAALDIASANPAVSTVSHLPTSASSSRRSAAILPKTITATGKKPRPAFCFFTIRGRLKETPQNNGFDYEDRQPGSPSLRGALATKQSRAAVLTPGSLRYARDDGGGNSTILPRRLRFRSFDIEGHACVSEAIGDPLPRRNSARSRTQNLEKRKSRFCQIFCLPTL